MRTFTLFPFELLNQAQSTCVLRQDKSTETLTVGEICVSSGLSESQSVHSHSQLHD